MNVKELSELTAYLSTLPEECQSSINIGACFDGYIFIEDDDDTLNADEMVGMGYVYISEWSWWALEGGFPV